MSIFGSSCNFPYEFEDFTNDPDDYEYMGDYITPSDSTKTSSQFKIYGYGDPHTVVELEIIYKTTYTVKTTSEGYYSFIIGKYNGYKYQLRTEGTLLASGRIDFGTTKKVNF